MKNSEFVTQWVISQVKEQYPDDIALVVSHTTLNIDPQEKRISYFIPITERGYQLSQTFILNGEGFDIWAVSWERMENFAQLEEYNVTCLADGEILYARTPEDAQRFEKLKECQKKNLSDGKKMRVNALRAYAQAKSIYSETLFAKGGDVKLGAGYVLDYLAQAIAFSNLRYFKKSQTDQIEELSSMDKIPNGFIERYQKVILEENDEIRIKLCYELICLVQKFLQQNSPAEEKINAQTNFQDLADWYGELSYTWLRIRHYAAQNDAVKAYMWGIMLQEELNHVCSDFGLEKMDLMSAYHSDKLDIFAEHSNRLEQKMRKEILNGGGIIHEYSSFEEFLHEI